MYDECAGVGKGQVPKGFLIHSFSSDPTEEQYIQPILLTSHRLYFARHPLQVLKGFPREKFFGFLDLVTSRPSSV